MSTMIYLFIGALSGGLTTLVGTGAGLVIIPALMFLAGFNEKTAVGTSLTLLLPPIGFFAVLTYWKHGYVNLKAAVIIGVAFMVASWVVARVATDLPTTTLERAFGIVAIIIGLKMFLAP